MEIISLIISALTLILGIIGFLFHDCKIKKLTLKQMKEEDELKRKADLCASLKLDGNLGAAKINIKNKGKAVARNIYIVRTDNKKLYINEPSVLPYEFLYSGNEFPVEITIFDFEVNKLNLTIVWDDDFAKGNQKDCILTIMQ
jgi:hypothetical protein